MTFGVDWSKPRWATEAAQRILEAEELDVEAAIVGDRYTSDAAYLESVAAQLTPASTILPRFPAFNQLLDPTWDGSSQNLYNNCGPSSLAMCVYHLTGVRLWDDDILDAMNGPTFRGYTTTDQLSKYLTERCGIPNRVTYDADPTARIQAALYYRHPVIALFYFDIHKPASGHFCPVYGYNQEGVYRANPWGASYQFMDYTQFSLWQKGYVVECLATAYYGR